MPRLSIIFSRGFSAWMMAFLASMISVADPARAESNPPTTNALDPEYGVGSWIWDSETRDQQLCRFWRGFEIPQSSVVVKARLAITADNSYRLFLDGRELGRGGDWQDLTVHDLALLLNPGSHTLAVEAFNDFKAAGVLVGLKIDLEDGRTIEIGSDQSWKEVPLSDNRWITRTRPGKDWPSATVVAAFLGGSWHHGPSSMIYATPLQPVTLRFWQTGWFQVILLSLCGAVAASCVWLAGKLALHSQAQQVLHRERARIARDIHDDVTAGLTQLVLLGEVAQSELPPGSEPRQQMSQICEKARGLSRSMNEVIWAVNSQRDTLRDFVSYVCKYTETFLQPTPIRCRFDIEEDMPNLPCDLGVRRNLFLAAKETLHNAIRHSHATEVILRIRHADGEVFVVLEDNGKGFDPRSVDSARNGLSNMARRATEVGGACVITSQPGAGCRVEFSAPLAGPAPKRFKWLRRLWKSPLPPPSRTPWSASALAERH
jgi:signal transduction histidine kinase